MRFYDVKTRSRCNEVPKKSGNGTKAPTINDAIALGLVPSVTEIINIVNKPYLATWMEDRAFKFAWDSAQAPISYEEARELYKQSSEQARDRGTELHDQMSRLEVNDFTQEAVQWLRERYVDIKHEVQFTFFTYGGTIDAICTKQDGSVDVLDFKFVMSERSPRDSELWQLAAYRNYIIHEVVAKPGTKVGAINLLILQETGKIVTAHEWSERDLERGYHTFSALEEAWQVINNYNILRGKRFYEKDSSD